MLDLDDFHVAKEGGRWSWKNGDLALTSWFREVGHENPFDIVHFVEWDLILFESCETLYADMDAAAVGLTALTPVAELEDTWEWVREPRRAEWQRLLAYARAEWGYDDVPYGCLAVGPCLPRSFLARYAEIDPPEDGNDELRLPLFAQILGFPLADTGFRLRWHDRREDDVFNVGGSEIEPATIRRELAKPDGRRAFHPVRRRDPLR